MGDVASCVVTGLASNIQMWSSRVGDVASCVVTGLASNIQVRAKRSPILEVYYTSLVVI